MEEFIVETEKACLLVPEEEREPLRAEVRGALKSSRPPKSNITREERIAEERQVNYHSTSR